MARPCSTGRNAWSSTRCCWKRCSCACRLRMHWHGNKFHSAPRSPGSKAHVLSSALRYAHRTALLSVFGARTLTDPRIRTLSADSCATRSTTSEGGPASAATPVAWLLARVRAAARALMSCIWPSLRHTRASAVLLSRTTAWPAATTVAERRGGRSRRMSSRGIVRRLSPSNAPMPKRLITLQRAAMFTSARNLRDLLTAASVEEALHEAGTQLYPHHPAHCCVDA